MKSVEATFIFGSTIAASRFSDVIAVYLDDVLTPLLTERRGGVLNDVLIGENSLHVWFHTVDHIMSYGSMIQAVHDSLSMVKGFPLISEDWHFRYD